MKTQRQKFEDWIDSLTFDQLHSLEERSAWIAWRAAIESISIQLPQPNDDSQDQIMRGVYAAIDKTGIKYE